MEVLYIDYDKRDLELFQLKARFIDPLLEITPVESIKEALELLPSGSFDCIVADIHLDSDNGGELLPSIKSTGLDLPVIFFTSKDDDLEAAKAKHAGFDDYFVKDFDSNLMQRLVNRMHELCEGKSSAPKPHAPKNQWEHFHITDLMQRLVFSEATREGLVIHNDGIIVDINDSFAGIVGAPRMDIIGINLKSFVEPEHQELVDQKILENSSQPYEVDAHQADGTRIRLEFQGISVFLSGKKFRIVAVRDLTRQWRVEQELIEKTKKLEAFNSMVSHDLRTPLWRIASYADMIDTAIEEKDFDSAHHSIDKLRSSVATMMDLIANLLTYSRINKADLTRERVNLSLLANEAIAAVNELYPNKKAVVAIEDGITAEGDIGMLRIVLENLFNNARKYSSRKSKPKVQFGVDLKGREAVYYIQDNGIGFPPEKQDEIFMPFRRLHSEKDYSGSGVGLATVKRIIEIHSGRIWAHSEEGKGATFYFTLG